VDCSSFNLRTTHGTAGTGLAMPLRLQGLHTKFMAAREPPLEHILDKLEHEQEQGGQPGQQQSREPAAPAPAAPAVDDGKEQEGQEGQEGQEQENGLARMLELLQVEESSNEALACSYLHAAIRQRDARGGSQQFETTVLPLLDVVEVAPGRVVARLPVTPAVCNRYQTLHGGCMGEPAAAEGRLGGGWLAEWPRDWQPGDCLISEYTS
jgi:hypothetical protein